jgi:hypothetical protein
MLLPTLNKNKIITMKFLISLYTLLFLLSVSAFSQVTISGTVIDSKTREPLEGVNVYLSETTIGKQTDNNGFFSFKTGESGPFKLVASSIGFHQEYVTINIRRGVNIEHNFRLSEKYIELDEVVVSADNTEWKSNFNLFKDFFIGDAKFANETYLVNPEILRFEGPNKNREISVFTEAPLVINNYDLGYVIETEFIEVRFNPSSNTGVYKLNMKFSEMESSNDDQLKRWQKNRSSAYLGSSTHFFKSLVQDRIRKEKFDVISKGAKIERLQETEVLKLALLYPRSWKTLVERYTVFHLTYEPVIVGHKLRYDQLDNVTNDHELSYLSYTGEIPFILIDDNGSLFDPSVLKLSGKWGFERVSVMLPVDFEHE